MPRQSNMDSYYGSEPRPDMFSVPARERLHEAHALIEQVAYDATPKAPVEVKMARDIGRLETELEQAHNQLATGEVKLDNLKRDKGILESRNTELFDEVQRLKKEVEAWRSSSIEYERLYNNYIAKQRKAARKRK